MDMRPCKLNLCTVDNFSYWNYLSIGFSSWNFCYQWLMHRGHSKMDGGFVAHTCTGENVKACFEIQFFSPLTAFLGVIFMENFCLVTKRTHKCEGCVLHTWEWPRTTGHIAANIVADKQRTL